MTHSDSIAETVQPDDEVINNIVQKIKNKILKSFPNINISCLYHVPDTLDFSIIIKSNQEHPVTKLIYGDNMEKIVSSISSKYNLFCHFLLKQDQTELITDCEIGDIVLVPNFSGLSFGKRIGIVVSIIESEDKKSYGISLIDVKSIDYLDMTKLDLSHDWEFNFIPGVLEKLSAKKVTKLMKQQIQDEHKRKLEELKYQEEKQIKNISHIIQFCEKIKTQKHLKTTISMDEKNAGDMPYGLLPQEWTHRVVVNEG